MQTNLADFIRGSARGERAEEILRKCVHCGFCTATCPTYQLLGDELDGPRGRIYQIKQVLEGEPATRGAQQRLDRCLTCLSCETTCPSGVEYHKLVEIGREVLEEQVPRPALERAARFGLRKALPNRAISTPMLRAGQLFRPLLPGALKSKVLPRRDPGQWPDAQRQRKMLFLDGCVQPAMAPNINAAAARVLDRLGIQLLRSSGDGCCGAVSQHLSAPGEAADYIRRNIDAWWPAIEAGAEAIVITASGCGALVQDYADLLRDDPNYADKAARVSELAKDICAVLRDEDLSALKNDASKPLVAFHAPCTLQHSLKLGGVVEGILRELGYPLTEVPDAHLCCGSAGTYSILQAKLSEALLDNKLAALQSGGPAVIATANIGCLHHLQSGCEIDVRHWIELVDAALIAA